jgi:polysaccharide deacetylase family protein (PEP-CTERM system associated)
MINALTVDVEDYFMVSAFSDLKPVDHWDQYECRLGAVMPRLLDLLERYGVKGTFFILGWVAERYPELVRDIRGRGHEVGCHSHQHRLVYDLTPTQFREDTRKAKGILEDILGEPIPGYRAPSYSVTTASLWALDILAEEGFEYDSSVYPVRHDRYGIPGFGRFPRRVGGNGTGGIVEIPPSTVRILGMTLPFGGGGYLRLFPAGWTEWALRELNGREGQPAVVYIHPWELDPDPPRMRGSVVSEFRHYVNIDTTEGKLSRLLQRFDFGPMRVAFGRHLQE